MKRTAPSLLVLLLVAACARAGGAPSTPSPSAPAPSGSGSGDSSDDRIGHPTAPTDPILVVDSAGGFAMPQMLATRLPQLVVYGDGRVITQGAQTLEFPGPALPPLIERTLTEEGIQLVLAAVEDTNLFTEDRELRGAMNVVADATDTVFTLTTDDREVTVTIYALGMLDPAMGVPEGVTAAEIQAHTVLSRLNEGLMTLDSWLPAEAWETEGWQPYEAEAFRLYVRDVTGQPVEGGGLPEQVREWPTGDDPAAFGEVQELFGDGTRCGVVTGGDAEAWAEELAAAVQTTLWTDDGERRFSVQARPLLPHEDGACQQGAGG